MNDLIYLEMKKEISQSKKDLFSKREILEIIEKYQLTEQEKSNTSCFLEYYKRLKLKQKIEEVRLTQFKCEFDCISKVLEPKRYEDSKIRINMQHNLLLKYDKILIDFGNVLLNYALTFDDRESKIFKYLYIDNMSGKEIAKKENLALSTIYNLKSKFKKQLDDLYTEKQ